jgi:hypothetical protein
LEEQDDPYKLEGFFPYTPLVWLTNGENIIPIPEYKIYRQKAVELDELSEKCRQIEEEVKYVVLVAGKNKETAVEIAKAPNGQVVSIGEFGIENLNQIIGVKPVDGAVTVLDHSTTREQVLKQDIYDLTGISDIIRGVSDPRETAEAQKIKGVFGSLRFQDRQKAVQEMFRKLFRIMTEIICEHWDEETLSEITCTYLPNQLDKANAQAQLQQEAQQAQAAGQQYNPNPELVKVLETPTWDDIMGVMQSDRLRNYTIDIETTATVFDDQEAQTAQINALTQAYLSLVQSAVQLQDPSLIKGFLPIVKMNLANIKISSAISGQLEEALEGAIKSFEEAKNAPPQPTPEEKKMQAEMQLAQMKLEAEGQQKDKEIQGRLQVEMAKVAADKEIAIQKILIDKGKLATDEGELGIKQQEADRKERELDAQIEFKQEEIERGIDINSNISGDVASIE